MDKRAYRQQPENPVTMKCDEYLEGLLKTKAQVSELRKRCDSTKRQQKSPFVMNKSFDKQPSPFHDTSYVANKSFAQPQPSQSDPQRRVEEYIFKIEDLEAKLRTKEKDNMNLQNNIKQHQNLIRKIQDTENIYKEEIEQQKLEALGWQDKYFTSLKEQQTKQAQLNRMHNSELKNHERKYLDVISQLQREIEQIQMNFDNERNQWVANMNNILPQKRRSQELNETTSMRAEYEKIKLQVESLEAANHELKSHISTISRQQVESQKDYFFQLETLKKNSASLQADLVKQLDQYKNTEEFLKQEIENITSQYEQQLQIKDAIIENANLDNLQKEIIQLKEDNKDLFNYSTKIQLELDQANAKNTDISQEINQLTQYLSQKDEEVKQLLKEIGIHQSDIHKLKDENYKLAVTNEDLQQETNNFQILYEQLKRKNHSLEEQLNDLSDQLKTSKLSDSLMQQSQETQINLNIQEHQDSLELQITQLKDELIVKQSQIDIQKGFIKSLEEDNLETQQLHEEQTQKLHENIQELMDFNKESQDKIIFLEEENANLKELLKVTMEINHQNKEIIQELSSNPEPQQNDPDISKRLLELEDQLNQQEQSHKAEIQQVNSTLEELSDNNDRQLLVIQKQEEIIIRKDADLIDQETKLQQLSIQIQQFHKDYNLTLLDYENLKESFQQQSSLIEQMKTHEQQLKEELLQKSVEIEEQQESFEAQIQALQDAHQQSLNQQQQSDRTNDSQSTELNQLKSKLEKVQSELAALQDIERIKQSELEILQTNLDKSLEQVKSLESQLETQTNKVDELISQNDDQQYKFEVLQDENQSLQAQVLLLQNEIDKLKSELTEEVVFQENITVLKDKISELQNIITVKESQIEELQSPRHEIQTNQSDCIEDDQIKTEQLELQIAQLEKQIQVKELEYQSKLNELRLENEWKLAKINEQDVEASEKCNDDKKLLEGWKKMNEDQEKVINLQNDQIQNLEIQISQLKIEAHEQEKEKLQSESIYKDIIQNAVDKIQQ